jgi:hypothetical protein
LPSASKTQRFFPRLPAAAGRLRRVVGGLCLMAQLLSLVHLALVRHATCVEHDALVHTEPASDTARLAGSPRQDSSARPSATDLVAPLALDSAGHADDHCLAVGCRRFYLTAGPADWSLAPASACAHSPAPAGIAPPAPVALLRLAPKSSPPSPRT